MGFWEVPRVVHSWLLSEQAPAVSSVDFTITFMTDKSLVTIQSDVFDVAIIVLVSSLTLRDSDLS